MALAITHPSLKQITLTVLRDGYAERAQDMLPTAAVTVIPSDPDEWADLPCITVQQMTDGENSSHIGDSLADQFIGDDIEVTVGNSYLATQVVEIRLFCKRKDERDRLGHMLPEVLLRGRGTSINPGPFITTDGLDMPKISGGHDEEISDTSKEFAPYPIYMRAFTLSALAEVTVQETAGPPLDTIDLYESSYDADLPIDLADTASQP